MNYLNFWITFGSFVYFLIFWIEMFFAFFCFVFWFIVIFEFLVFFPLPQPKGRHNQKKKEPFWLKAQGKHCSRVFCRLLFVFVVWVSLASLSADPSHGSQRMVVDGNSFRAVASDPRPPPEGAAVAFSEEWFHERWPGSFLHSLPRRWFEPHDSHQLFSGFCCCPQERRLRMSLQLVDQLPCHWWVTSANHGQTVTPTRPVSWHACSCSTSQANPSQHHGQWTEILRLTSMGQRNGFCKISSRHFHIPTSCASQKTILHCQAQKPVSCIWPLQKYTATKQPRRLDIGNHRNPLHWLLMFLDSTFQMGAHELWVPQWSSNSSGPLPTCADGWIRHPFQNLASSGFHPCAIPHLRCFWLWRPSFFVVVAPPLFFLVVSFFCGCHGSTFSLVVPFSFFFELLWLPFFWLWRPPPFFFGCGAFSFFNFWLLVCSF